MCDHSYLFIGSSQELRKLQLETARGVDTITEAEQTERAIFKGFAGREGREGGVVPGAWSD